MPTPEWLVPGETALLAAAAKWKPEAHPRGNDGKFIEKGHIASFLSMKTSTIGGLLNAVHSLNHEKWGKLKPEQQQHIADAVDKLPAATDTAKSLKQKIADLGGVTSPEHKTPSDTKVIAAHKGAAPGKPAKVSTTLVWAKHEPGTTILNTSDGKQRIVWNGKKYEVQQHDGAGWKTVSAHTKKDFYDTHKKDDSWVVPDGAPTSETVKPEVPKAEVSKPTLTPEAPTSAVVWNGSIKDKTGDQLFKQLQHSGDYTFWDNINHNMTQEQWSSLTQEQRDNITMQAVDLKNDSDWESNDALNKIQQLNVAVAKKKSAPSVITPAATSVSTPTPTPTPMLPKPKKPVKKSPASVMGYDTSSEGLSELGFPHHTASLTPEQHQEVADLLDNVDVDATLAYIPSVGDQPALRLVKTSSKKYAVDRDNGAGGWTKISSYDKSETLALLNGYDWQISSDYFTLSTDQPAQKPKKGAGFDTSSEGLAQLGFIQHGDELTNAQKSYLKMNMGTAYPGSVIAYYPSQHGQPAMRFTKTSTGTYDLQIDNEDGTWTTESTKNKFAALDTMTQNADWQINDLYLALPNGSSTPKPEPEPELAEWEKELLVEAPSKSVIPSDFGVSGAGISWKQTENFKTNLDDAPEGTIVGYVDDPMNTLRVTKKTPGGYLFEFQTPSGDWVYHSFNPKSVVFAELTGKHGKISEKHLADPLSSSPNVANTGVADMSVAPTVDAASLKYLDGSVDWFQVNALAKSKLVQPGTAIAQTLNGKYRIIKSHDNQFVLQQNVSGNWLDSNSGAKADGLAVLVATSGKWGVVPTLTFKKAEPDKLHGLQPGQSLQLSDSTALWKTSQDVPSGTVIAEGTFHNNPARIIMDDVSGLQAQILKPAFGDWQTYASISNIEQLDHQLGVSSFAWKMPDSLSALKAPVDAKAPSASSVPKVAPTAPTLPDPPTSGDGGDISHIPHGVVQSFKAKLKEDNVGYWSKPEKIWESVQKIQAEHPEYTPLQILKSMDSTLKTKEPSPFETKMVKWGKTPKGAAAIGAHGLAPGGTGVGISKTPSVPSTPTAAPAGLFPNEGPGDVGHLSAAQKADIYKAFKSHHGTFIDSSEKSVYTAISSVAQQHGLSDLQVLRVVDEVGAEKAKKSNGHLFEQKITKWLQTPKGSIHAASVAGKSDTSMSKMLANKVPDFAPGVDPMKDLPSFDESSKLTYHTITVEKTYEVFGASKTAHEEKTGQDIVSAPFKPYTGGAYIPINQYLYGDVDVISPSHANHVKKMQKNMVPSTQPMLLHRGVSFDALGAVNAADLEKKVGQTWYSAGFSSTSVGDAAAFSHLPAKLEIEAPPGTPMHWVKPVSHWPNENEMLLAAGLSYKIVSVKTAGNTAIVRLRVVPEEPTI